MSSAGGLLLKNKKGIIIFISAFILVVAIISAIVIPTASKNFLGKYFRRDLKNVDAITLIARCSEIDGKKNSVAGFKESVRLGADAVIMDLCFRSDGTPVLCDSYPDADTAGTAEELFEAMTAEKYSDKTVYLNIIQLSDISRLNELAVKYDIVGRLFLIGIDSEHYGLITSDETIIPILLDYKFSSQELSDIKDGSFKVPDVIERYGAAGLVVESSQLSRELADTLGDYGIFYIADGVKTTSRLCEMLSIDVRNAVVPDIEKARTALNQWIDEMQKRYKASLESSIAAISQKS